MLMMFGGVMLGDIVAEVLHTWVPVDADILVSYLVDDPEVPHFHGSGALTFDGAISDAYSCGIVTVNGRGRLGMAHFV
jgi:hypothetical protein